MFEFLGDIGNYEDRKVGRDALENGLQVSTAYTSDEGYETAIIFTDGFVCPVERYGFSSATAAAEGHKKWKEFASDGIGKSVTMLGGLGGLAPSERKTIR